MILVLAHHYDAEAEWLRKTLREGYAQAALLLWPEALGVDYDISLRLRANGNHDATVSMFEPPSRTSCERSARYVVNRLGYIEPLIWKNAAPSEKAYATAEINS